MAFRFKDLMIQVVPKGGGEDDPACTLASKEPDPAGIVPCTLASQDPETGGGFAARARACAEASEAQCTCTLATKMDPVPAMIGCTLASRIETQALGTITTVTTVTTVTTLVQGGRGGDLASLKAQLRAALEDVERQERAQQGDGGLPATVEEADDLERRLREAIEELQDHRKTLQRSEKGAESGGGSKTASKGGAKKARGRK